MEISKIFRGDLRHVGWMHRIRAPLPCFSVQALQILRMLCQIPPWQSWWLNCHVGLGFLQLLLLSRSLWSTGKTHRKCAARCIWYIYIYVYMIENCHCCIWLWNISKHWGTLCSSVKLRGFTLKSTRLTSPSWSWTYIHCRSEVLSMSCMDLIAQLSQLSSFPSPEMGSASQSVSECKLKQCKQNWWDVCCNPAFCSS